MSIIEVVIIFCMFIIVVGMGHCLIEELNDRKDAGLENI